jgi:phage protein D
MTDVHYRLYIGGTPATQEQLDLFEEITVHQAIDQAWEARLKMPVKTDDGGHWTGEADSDPLTGDFARIRIEIKVGNGNFTALIDGPVVGHDSNMSSEPGESEVTLIVHDDSVYLNRVESTEPWPNLLDHEIAQQIFNNHAEIATTDIDTTPSAGGGLSPQERQRSTDIQLLRRLARRNGLHAYVLPGDTPGASVGLFRALPGEPGDLPDLVLLGKDRNIASFQVRNDMQSASQVQAYSLSITDKVVTTATSSTRDLSLLGDEGALSSESNAATRLVGAGQDGAVSPEQAVQAEAARDAFAFEANGTVVADCYHAVLQPYRAVTARGVNGRLSGLYVIKSVEHQLTRSLYKQDFVVMRNARSSGASGSDLASAAASVF